MLDPQVLCSFLTKNFLPTMAAIFDPVFWGPDLAWGPGLRGEDWWIALWPSYLDADRDGKVTIHEFYDMKIVQILRIIFDGLDANGDGVVKQHEARLESFLRRNFLYSLTEELFDYADLNNDNQISVEDIPLCEQGGSPFCLKIRAWGDLSNKTKENCNFFPSYSSRIFISPLRQVCTTLMNTFLSPEFDT